MWFCLTGNRSSEHPSSGSTHVESTASCKWGEARTTPRQGWVPGPNLSRTFARPRTLLPVAHRVGASSTTGRRTEPLALDPSVPTPFKGGSVVPPTGT